MDYLWSPWRFRYLTAAVRPEGCVFCSMAASPEDDERNLIVRRGTHNFIVLNLFPYTNGHLMVVPYAHASDLSGIGENAAIETMLLARRAERHLRAVYRPDGINLGMNIGESAGAGIAGHIHMHVLPRWHGDANFMTTVAETRVLPEELPVTWRRLREAFDAEDRMADFDRQPALRGELLELRPLRADDFAGLYAAASDPLIWEQHPAHDRCREEVFRVFFDEALASGGALAAIDRQNGRIIGTSRFHGFDPKNREIEIGWTFLARPFWGGVWNGEMKRLMLKHAFRFVDSVVFLIAPRNLRSQKAVEKIGGVRDGSRRNAAGSESFLYRILRPGR